MTTDSLAKAFADSDREFWHGVLTGGGFAPIPRWTLDPVPGVAACEAAVPRDLLPALRQRAAEVGLAGPAFETVFDALGGEGVLAPGTVLWVAIWPQRDRLALRLRYRTDALDADAAARIAGYHLTALTLIAADPEAEHGRQSLLSPAELGFQLDGLAGPDRELPDRRTHELFEQRVRAHPDAIAAVLGDRQWTYAELNARANRLARALLARGL